MNVYKRILSYVLSLLLLLSLAACAPQGEDYGDFVPPEETDTLVIYANPSMSYLMNNAIARFTREYPDVEIEYRHDNDWRNDSSNMALQSELAAGEGPDLIVDYEFVLFTDLHTFKAMENNVYADLAPFFAWDDEIDLADYNEAVMNSGMYMDHQYMVPVFFESMAWITTQELLDETGLDLKSGRQDFIKVMDMLRAYKQENPEQIILSSERVSAQILWLLCPWSGAESVNMETRQITVGTEEFRAVVDAYKDLFYEDDWVNKIYAPDNGTALLDRETLFQYSSGLFNIAMSYLAVKETETPVLLNCPSFDGQAIGKPDTCAFIREGSPNQLNAWRFLKILLSEDLQADSTNYGTPFPVLRSAAKARFTELFKREHVTEEEIDAILDVVYEVDDCRVDPLLGWTCDILAFPYIEDGSSYESCLLTLEDKLTLMLNE